MLLEAGPMDGWAWCLSAIISDHAAALLQEIDQSNTSLVLVSKLDRAELLARPLRSHINPSLLIMVWLKRIDPYWDGSCCGFGFSS